MKGLLVAFIGGGLPAGFVAHFAVMANKASGITSLELLWIQSIFHMPFFFYLRWKKAPLFGPPEACLYVLRHATVNVISIGCAYSSFMLVPRGNGTTVRKGSSTISSILFALCFEKNSTGLTGYDWFGLAGSTLGLIMMLVPDPLNLDQSTQLYDTFGYVLACSGGLALALGLVIFRGMDFPDKLVTVTFIFAVIGSPVYSPVMFLLQEPVITVDPLTWTYVIAISLLALMSYLCASYAVTKVHLTLVCAILHSEVLIVQILQYYITSEEPKNF